MLCGEWGTHGEVAEGRGEGKMWKIIFIMVSGKEWARQRNRASLNNFSRLWGKSVIFDCLCLILELEKMEKHDCDSPRKKVVGIWALHWLTCIRCAHRWVVHLWELDNYERHSSSRVRKASDVKSSEIQKIKGKVDTVAISVMDRKSGFCEMAQSSTFPQYFMFFLIFLEK